MKEENQKHSDIQGSDEFPRGTILLSSPMLNDPNFKRTAILILDQDESGGHIGLVLNRPLDITLSDICKMPGKYAKQFVHHGGPVDLQRMFWLHSLGDLIPGSLEILPGLYVGGDYDAMISLFEEGRVDLDHKIHFYLGYSGWGKEQLKAETAAGAWGILPMLIDSNLIFDLDGEELWHQLCLLLSPEYRHWRMIPSDPELN
ncbi:MAG: YqgE/AlgH family protein [Muribaculaceae bacterium]|nr:YqgE/AlgH family protein [Muribaculaceae bacterium]